MQDYVPTCPIEKLLAGPHLAYILTLRYDPYSKSELPIFGPNIFNKFITDRNSVEHILTSAIAEFITTRRPNRVALALSGGVDSTLTLILLRDMFPELKISCVSAGFSSDDPDVAVARETARTYDADFENLELNDFLHDLPRQVYVVREPKANYYWYTVAKAARLHSDILVTGDGADELFAGYVFRYHAYLQEFRNDMGWQERVSLYTKCHNRDWVPDQTEMFGPAVKFSWEFVWQSLRRFFDNPLNSLQQVWLADYHGKLARDWVLAHGRIYRSLGMTGFSPFLVENVIRHSFGVSAREKYDYKTNVGKIVLRNMLAGRGCHIGTEKKGFTPDILRYWDTYGKSYAQIYLLDNSRTTKAGLISGKWVRRAMIRANDHNIRYVNRLLHLIGLEVWYRVHISGEMGASDRL